MGNSKLPPPPLGKEVCVCEKGPFLAACPKSPCQRGEFGKGAPCPPPPHTPTPTFIFPPNLVEDQHGIFGGWGASGDMGQKISLLFCAILCRLFLYALLVPAVLSANLKIFGAHLSS